MSRGRRRRTAARDASRRPQTEPGKFGSALMTRVSSDHRRPSSPGPCTEAGGYARRSYAIRPRFDEDLGLTKMGDPTRGEARSPDAGRTGSQPTESEFEEITADTLLGSHFV